MQSKKKQVKYQIKERLMQSLMQSVWLRQRQNLHWDDNYAWVESHVADDKDDRLCN